MSGKKELTARFLPPGSTIGLLGGGQLGRMLGLAGRAMGFRFVTLDPAEDAPAAAISDRHICAEFGDLQAAQELAQYADVVTYEFENVDASVAEKLCSATYVPQGSQLLHTTQHRLREKRAIEAAGVPVAPYRPVTSLQSLEHAIEELGLPAVLKTVTGGYDGKGQWVIRQRSETEQAYDTLSKTGVELVLEQFIPFEKEISVVAARNANGQVQCFPTAENRHVDNILHTSVVPAHISREIDKQAQRIARQIADSLNVVGLIAVEMFVTAEESIYVNETAPRPHNSGHYTMEGCRTSQFEQHIRAICGWTLGDPASTMPVVMVNVLGEHLELLEQWLERGEVPDQLEMKVHLYGKTEARPKRKMGHVNILCQDESGVQLALDWIKQSGIWQSQEESS